MKHGHVTGTKRERKGASDWYKEIEEAKRDFLDYLEARFSLTEVQRKKIRSLTRENIQEFNAALDGSLKDGLKIAYFQKLPDKSDASNFRLEMTFTSVSLQVNAQG